jgi:hypothetical protein
MSHFQFLAVDPLVGRRRVAPQGKGGGANQHSPEMTVAA